MFPKSFSASALKVASLCLSRYAAENFFYADRMQNEAAGLGTAVHGALEEFVKKVFIDQTQEYDLKHLLDLFDISYLKVFRRLDKESVDHQDGVYMLTEWFKRDDIRSQGRTVLSAEKKTSFPVTVAGYPVTPFNYIWDRFDKMSNRENEFTVVDYKTNRWALNSTDLKRNVQARAYGLAAQIQHPEAVRIWVEFDFLRHDGGPVGVVFTQEDNKQTWRDFKKVFQFIWDTDENNAPETLNGECLFCVRKAQCGALASNTKVGGTFGLSPDEMIDRRAKAYAQMSGLKALVSELDDLLLDWSRETEVFEHVTNLAEFQVGLTSARRGVDASRAKLILGDELWGRYGKESMTVGEAEALIKGNELTEQQKRELRMCISKPPGGTPSVKTKIKGTI